MALADNLVAWYKFDESSGNAADSVGSKTLTNNSSVPFVAGKINNAADFEASSVHNFSRTDTAFSQGGDFTVSAWIKSESNGGAEGSGIVLYTTSESEGDWVLALDGVEITFYGRTTGGSWARSNGGAISTGTWYHVVGRRSGGTRTIWINGVSQTLTTPGTSTGWGQQNFCLGVFYPDPTWSFDGLVDMVGVWSRAISNAEVAELYNSGTGLDYPFGAGGLTKSVADPLTLGELVTPVLTPGAPSAFPAHYYHQLMAA